MDYFNSIEEKDEFRQGDIFKVGQKCENFLASEENYAILITADCDIAQKKSGDFYTLLPIISVEHYMEKVWLIKEIKTIKNTLVSEFLSFINKKANYEKFDCDPLTKSQLIDWLSIDSINEVFNKLKIECDKKDITKKVSNYEQLTKVESVADFVCYRKSSGRGESKIINELKSALNNLSQEYFFIPEISLLNMPPSIIKLRDIRAINKERVFKSSFSLRMDEKDPKTSVIRVGRTTDYLRFSIVQSFANLFSRIGMTEIFEEDSNLSKDTLVNKLIEAE